MEREAPASKGGVSSYADGDETPKGTILFEREVSKAGSGLMKNKFKPVHGVIHQPEGHAALLSVRQARAEPARSWSRARSLLTPGG